MPFFKKKPEQISPAPIYKDPQPAKQEPVPYRPQQARAQSQPPLPLKPLATPPKEEPEEEVIPPVEEDEQVLTNKLLDRLNEIKDMQERFEMTTNILKLLIYDCPIYKEMMVGQLEIIKKEYMEAPQEE